MKSFLFALFLLINTSSIAQVLLGGVLYPSSATSCTNTIVTVPTTQYCANYAFTGSNVTFSGNNMTIHLYWTVGLICLPAIVSVNQSVNLGNLPSGSYNVIAKSYLNNVYSASSGTSQLTVIPCCSAVSQFDFVNDSICVGDTIGLENNTTNADSIKWFNSTGYWSSLWEPTMIMDSAGVYDITLVAYADTCNDTITKTLTVLTNPVINIGPDTALCDGQVLNLSVAQGFSSILWSDGSTNNTNTISAIGSKSVIVTNANGCSAYDTINIYDIWPYADVDLGPDTTICLGDSSSLSSGGGLTNYLWSTGATSSSISTGFGTFWLEAYGQNECASRDTITVNYHTLSTFSITDDSNDCGTSTLGTSINFSSYVWNTGSFNSTTVIDSSGTYSVTVEDNNGCEQTQSILAVVYDLPMVELGNDTDYCGEPFSLVSGASGTHLWSSGSATQTYLVNTTGTVWVQVTDENGCVGRDTIKIKQCVGLETLSNGVKIYPQPADEFIHLNSAARGTYRIFSLDGKILVSEALVPNAIISVSSLPSGSYLLEVDVEGRSALRQPLLIAH